MLQAIDIHPGRAQLGHGHARFEKMPGHIRAENDAERGNKPAQFVQHGDDLSGVSVAVGGNGGPDQWHRGGLVNC
jgi:hypothetical protein